MSTALVPVAPANRSEPFTGAPRPPSAPFLAHLIATARQAPQTRLRRRAEPEQAAAAYAAAPRRASCRRKAVQAGRLATHCRLG